MEWIRQQFAKLAGTRWLVIAGVVAALFVFVASLVAGTQLVAAFFLALAADGIVVGLAGVARLIWKGAEVTSAPIPGGGSLDVDALKTVQQGLEDLNKRADAHTETENRRLYDLEKRVFKESATGTTEEE